MAVPLLDTKLHPPTSSHARIDRPRLSALLDDGARSRLTLVSAGRRTRDGFKPTR